MRPPISLLRIHPAPAERTGREGAGYPGPARRDLKDYPEAGEVPPGTRETTPTGQTRGGGGGAGTPGGGGGPAGGAGTAGNSVGETSQSGKSDDTTL